jgi:hypothetical protein
MCKIEFEIKKIMLKVKKNKKNTITIQNKSSHMLQCQKPSSFRFVINFNDVPFFFNFLLSMGD